MTDPTGLLHLVGSWSGTDQLWFEPDQLANECAVAAIIRPTLGGRGVIHEYRWSFGDDAHHGSMLIVPSGTGHEAALADTFHTGGGIMRLTPPEESDPDSVVDTIGSYDADGERWGWRVVVHQPDHDHLEVTSWNVAPDGQASRATLTQLTREVDPADVVTV